MSEFGERGRVDVEQSPMDAALEAGDSCNCAPSTAERRTLWDKSGLTRRNALGVGVLSVAALSAFGIGSGVSAAYAASYPSWDDVQRAKQNEAAKASEVSRIQGLIQSLTQKVAETQAAAEAAGNEFYEAQQAYFEAIAEAEALQAQADEQAQIADESARKAGQVAGQLYRNGGDDTALELFFSGSAANADELLSRLGTMDKLLGYNQSVYDKAVAARNSAQSLSDQAAVARTERDRLQKIAEQKMLAAQQAAVADRPVPAAGCAPTADGEVPGSAGVPGRAPRAPATTTASTSPTAAALRSSPPTRARSTTRAPTATTATTSASSTAGAWPRGMRTS